MPEAIKQPAEQPPESGLEQQPVRPEARAETASAPEKATEETARAADAITPEVLAAAKDELLMNVEKILEARLKDVFKSLPEDKRLRFKKAGETLAGELRQMLEQKKFDAAKILGKEEKWLRMVPLNPYFSQQESAVKTLQLKRLHDEMREERELGVV